MTKPPPTPCQRCRTELEAARAELRRLETVAPALRGLERDVLDACAAASTRDLHFIARCGSGPVVPIARAELRRRPHVLPSLN